MEQDYITTDLAGLDGLGLADCHINLTLESES